MIIASYADHNTLYASSSNLNAVINKLEETINNLFQWFRYNHMKANADKRHLLVTDNYEVSANTNEFEIESSKKKEKLLRISIDTRLSFEHVTSLCKKASQKLQALARVKKKSKVAWAGTHGLQKTKFLNESICNIPI